jgi:DNA-binding FrmR family transcriptional regulator
MALNKEVLKYLKISRGQIDAVIRMVEEERYCVEIANQILAVQALLKKANLDILETHIKGCVINSFEKGDSSDKIKEVMSILDKYIK